jgi:glyoxylase-like metal-dependent hydrolase (beta-lactamase superfamily II)
MLSQLSAAASSFGLSADNSPAPDKTLEDGDVITFGTIALNVLHTPGHSPGGVSLHTNGMVFVGDLLFSGSIGRTDLPGGDFGALVASVKNKIFPLGDDVIVYSGHGPETTVAQEKKFNPFVGER